MNQSERLRKINLIEVLREDAEAEGVSLQPVDEDELLSWSEADIRAFFASGGARRPAPATAAAAAAPLAPGGLLNGCDHGKGDGGGAPGPGGDAVPQQARVWEEPSPEELRKWFPALKPEALQSASAVVLCFPNSGSAEDMYSSEGTGARRAPSPLLEWCRARGAALMAVQPPGRALRSKEPPLPDLRALAAALLPVGHSSGCLAAGGDGRPELLGGGGAQRGPQGAGPRRCSAGCPAAGGGGGELLGGSGAQRQGAGAARRYFVVGHSVGAWAACEFLLLARSRGLPMPAAAFLSAMPSPDIPEGERPWRRQAALGDAEFKARGRGEGGGGLEECRGWDINEVVFSPDLWPAFQPLLRADFRLFDEYARRPAPGSPPAAAPTAADEPGQQGRGQEEAAAAAPFAFPITAFWGERDRRITERMVQGWSRFTAGGFELVALAGANHLWPSTSKDAKREWLARIARGMEDAAA
ncbi:MAG: Alpha/Beta hydrolase protein [Monoraphidium minutum]|nr:MAG: Alpha/Beta hydrolase protein [Monoraphidium minutum]